MSIRSTPWPAGVPSWTDLMAPDVPAACAFYGAVLGWTFTEPDEQYGGYVVASYDGSAAAGIGPVMPGARADWTLYFASDDADATAQAVRDNGGMLHREPADVGPLGRMVIAADPAGATFGVWQAGTHLGAEVVNQAGGLVWEDLRSTNPDAARAFYSAVFGFRNDAMPMAGPAYQTFSLPDEEAPMGGMGDMMGADDKPSHWLVYFGVADINAAVTAATEHGGTVATAPFETPFGQMAGVTDPGGALFWTVEMGAADLPDRSS